MSPNFEFIDAEQFSGKSGGRMAVEPDPEKPPGWANLPENRSAKKREIAAEREKSKLLREIVDEQTQEIEKLKAALSKITIEKVVPVKKGRPKTTE